MEILFKSPSQPLLKDRPDGLYADPTYKTLILKVGDRIFFLPNGAAGHIVDCRNGYLPIKTLTVEV